MIYGYAGKVLRVNLTDHTMYDQVIPEEMLRQYLGGSGLGARLLYDETDSSTDPLGPENILIFLTGPIEGTKVPNAGRYEVISRSPLTGSYGEANSGGKWGMKLKQAGYDGVIFSGISERPVYLYLKDGVPELLDAGELWGKDTYETDRILREKYGNKACTCGIGVAGEKMSRLAAIMNDGEDARAAGRCGLGAVMGSKRVKAICVDGTMKTPLANEEALNQSIAISIGQDADDDVLQQFTGNRELVLQANNPQALVKMIKWASTAASLVSAPASRPKEMDVVPAGNNTPSATNAPLVLDMNNIPDPGSIGANDVW